MSKVNITVHSIELSFDNSEPTREQIAEKLCEYVNNNVFSYSELRHNNTEESVSEQLMNDLEPIQKHIESLPEFREDRPGSSIADKNYINHDIKQSHTVTSNLSTFGELEEAFDDALKMSKDMSIGRASVEQGGNRDSNMDSIDRDPLNE